jgi:hypothetical protein
MRMWQHRQALLFGVGVGVVFGVVNLLHTWLYPRADWQNMMMRFRASGVDSLRVFVNLDYLQGAPFKLAVSCAIGALMGSVGGLVGQLTPRRVSAV